MDILETENDLIFKVDAAGVNLKDIDIQLENGTLTLKGERRLEKDDKVKSHHRIERGYGAFARSFTLPDTGHCRNRACRLHAGGADGHSA